MNDAIGDINVNIPEPVEGHRLMDLYTLDELASKLSMPKAALKKLALEGKIPCLQAGGLYFSLPAVKAALYELAATSFITTPPTGSAADDPGTEPDLRDQPARVVVPPEVKPDSRVLFQNPGD